MQLQLQKFDLRDISDDSTIVLLGRRKSGKSILTKSILYEHRHIPIGTVISATESANKFYGDMVPSLFIHDEFTPEILENVIKRQKIIKKKMNKEIQKFGKSRIDPRAFLIMDDCLFDNSWTKDKNIRTAYLNGRHYHMLFIVTMQYPLGLPPVLRSNVDFIFIFRENITSNRRRIYDNYAGMFPDFQTFCSVLDQCTENFECLVIKVNASSNRLEDQVFWYKADLVDNFRVGSKEFWALHNDQYDNDQDQEEDEYFDVEKLMKHKKKTRINVKKTSNY